MYLIILFIILVLILKNKKKKVNKKINYTNIDQVFKFADKNKNGKLSIQEMLDNFDSNGRTISTEIFIATILDYQVRNKKQILINNELSLQDFRKLSISDLKLDLFDENKKDKNGNLLPINQYAQCLLNKSRNALKNYLD
jgi:hypothetical protein